jgi:hypothetical protein
MKLLLPKTMVITGLAMLAWSIGEQLSFAVNDKVCSPAVPCSILPSGNCAVIDGNPYPCMNGVGTVMTCSDLPGSNCRWLMDITACQGVCTLDNSTCDNDYLLCE